MLLAIKHLAVIWRSEKPNLFDFDLVEGSTLNQAKFWMERIARWKGVTVESTDVAQCRVTGMSIP